MAGLSAAKLATPSGLPDEEGGGDPAGPKTKPVKGRMSSSTEPTATHNQACSTGVHMPYLLTIRKDNGIYY